MAATAGRKLRIKYDADGAGGTAAAVIAGARTDNFSIDIEGIDITDKDDAGVRTFLDDIGAKSISATVEGVLKDDTLMTLFAAATEGSALHQFDIDVSGLGTFVGQWRLSSFAPSGAEGSEPTTFTMNIESSGAITYS